MQQPSSLTADASGARTPSDPRGARKIQVLYAGDMEFARSQFASEAPELQLTAAADVLKAGSGSAAAAGRPAVDVAFVDCGAPNVNAAALLEELRQQRPDLPVVLAVDPSRDDGVRAAVELQADDYTVKAPGWLSRLPVRLAIVISRQRRLGELQALQAREQRLRSIVESAPVCFVRVGADGTILAMNTAARTMMGAGRPADVLKKSFFSFVTPENQEPSRQLIDLACAGQAASQEFSIAPAAGVSRSVEASAIALPSDSGGTSSALLVLRDVTARRRLEQSVVAKAEAEGGPSPTASAPPAPAAGEALKVAELERQLRDVATERDRLREAVEQARAATQTLGERLQRQELVCGTLETERDELRRGLEQERQRQEADSAGALEARQQLEHRLRAADAQLKHAAEQSQATIDQQLRDWKARCQQVEAERDELRRALDERRVRDDQDVAARQALEERLQDAEASLKRLADEAQETLTRQLHDWKVECHRLETERNALHAALESTRSRYSAEAAASREACQAIELQLEDVDRARAEATAERDGLKAALGEAHARHAEVLAEEVSIRRVLELRLRQAEKESKRLAAERDESIRAVQARRARRDELVRALLESDQHEQLARRWMGQCAALEEALQTARAEFEQLADWARVRHAAAASTGVGPDAT
jgi:PAS domain S-box-containing protein